MKARAVVLRVIVNPKHLVSIANQYYIIYIYCFNVPNRNNSILCKEQPHFFT